MTSAAAASPRARSTTIEPTITIAIPVYNREHLVKKALESALRQPERDLEVLVVDNASTDGTWEVLSSFPDPRLRLVRNDRNLGLFGNFNRCIFLARGRYVVTLCSDDMLLDGFLAPARRLLDTHPEVGLVSSRGRGLNDFSLSRNVKPVHGGRADLGYRFGTLDATFSGSAELRSRAERAQLI